MRRCSPLLGALLLGCGTAQAPSDAGTADATTKDAPADAPARDGGAACSVPHRAAELLPYLEAGGYRSFLAQSSVHPTVSPHGDVRGWVSPELEASLRAGNAQHPPCAAAVKELYEPDMTTLHGWAVWVKLESGRPAGQGFYWYELLSRSPGAKPTADGMGVQAASCHSGGRDYVIMDWPLK